MLRAAILFFCIWANLAIAGNDVYDPHTGILSIPSLQIGETFYANTRLQLSPSGQWSLIEVGAQADSAVPLSIMPTSFSAGVGDQLTVSITGGTPPYYVVSSSSNAFVSHVSQSGGFAAATLLAARAGNAVVVVTDSAGQQVSSSLTISAGSSPLYVSPSNAAVRTGTGVTIFISGGWPPYSVNSSNTHVARVDSVTWSNRAVASAMSTLYTIGEGSATILISDSIGAMTSMTITATR